MLLLTLTFDRMDEARYTYWVRQKLIEQISECGGVLWKVDVSSKKVVDVEYVRK